ncbi:MAG: hypothetical protein KBD26_00570 [Candidatus Pacebacteria bacterium]|nr:hypothetical protein [Candidatus Paceibacterota bacterium]MBP9772303.1 hypothetical protein [Candidatus Paceibacterota bacterium]QQR76852.1 MAG: hypothetical protein IPJ63_01110 [Candidatus Nomurabacteria bacterium]
MNTPSFLIPIINAIEVVGYVKFFILVVASIILYRIHPILGILGISFTLALTLGILG